MASSLVFSVQRQKPVLVTPAKPTPHEFKPLSDIDDQDGLRFQVPVIQFYRNDPSMEGRDPAKVIREALAEALVPYYPLAGRLREGPGRKLVVECTGEGVLFIEADADVRLDHFGDELQPAFTYLDELLFNIEGSDGVVGCPLLLIQVTRLKCGGFIFAIRMSHTISDGQGMAQFMTAIGEMARGATAPIVRPVWGRELLNARMPPCPTYVLREYDEMTDATGLPVPLDDMEHRSFFFGDKEVAAMRMHVPPHLHNSSRFEIITACLWRSRTRAMQPDPEEEVRIMLAVNARSKFNPPFPTGYYGNAFAVPVAISMAGKLCQNPVGYALELIKKAKSEVTEEYMHSVADLMVLRGRPHFSVVRACLVSDVTRIGFRNVDFGWGPAVYSGPAKAGVGAIPGVISFYTAYRNGNGEDGVVVPVMLPGPAMERFIGEIDSITKEPAEKYSDTTSPRSISAL